MLTVTGQGHFVTSHLGDNMASATWATKVSTKWVDQIDQLTDIFEEVSLFCCMARSLRSLRLVATLRHGHKARRLAPAFRALGGLPVTWLNTIWLNFFVESLGLKILSQVTTKLGQLHSNSRNKYVNSRKYNVGHMRCMHARPHRRKDQLPLRSLRDLRSRRCVETGLMK